MRYLFLLLIQKYAITLEISCEYVYPFTAISLHNLEKKSNSKFLGHLTKEIKKISLYFQPKTLKSTFRDTYIIETLM